jgi:hypothetical protein
MLDNTLVSDVGQINGACTKANVSWQILKYPGELKYTALLTPVKGELGAAVLEAGFIDDLFEKIIKKAKEFEC